MRIELLYVEGCPNLELARERLWRALRELGSKDAVTEILVTDAAAASRLGFLGSPSIRIDGVDIEPTSRPRRAFGLACRTYGEDGQPQGAPSQKLIEKALGEGKDG
jgi:hypothetical protein